MSALLLFLPDLQNSPAPDQLAARGLDWIRGHPFSHAQCVGPVGQSGSLLQLNVGPAGVKVKSRFEPAEQVWFRGGWADRQGYHFGWIREHPPGPNDLIRDETFIGHEVELADGNRWLIPALVATRPRRLRIEHGSWVTPMPPDAELLAAAVPYWESLDKDAPTPRFSDMIDLAARLLGVHYVLGRDQVSALGLLETKHVTEILGAALDLPSLFAEFAARKKNDDEPVLDPRPSVLDPPAVTQPAGCSSTAGIAV